MSPLADAYSKKVRGWYDINLVALIFGAIVLAGVGAAAAYLLIDWLFTWSSAELRSWLRGALR